MGDVMRDIENNALDGLQYFLKSINNMYMFFLLASVTVHCTRHILTYSHEIEIIA